MAYRDVPGNLGCEPKQRAPREPRGRWFVAAVIVLAATILIAALAGWFRVAGGLALLLLFVATS